MLRRLALAGVLGMINVVSLAAQSAEPQAVTPQAVTPQAVTGRVVDSATGAPAPERYVQVRPLHGGRWAGVQTDATGNFYIAATPASDYRVQVTLPDGTSVVRDSLAVADFAHPIAVAYSDAERRHMYFEFEVDRTAVPIDPQPPEYPHGASAAGEVLVQYAVDSDGRPVLETFRILRSPDRLLSDAVRQAVATYHFQPARKAGRPVRQLVQQPFVFHR